VAGFPRTYGHVPATAGYDLDAQLFAHLPDNRSYPLPQRTLQHLVVILRDPDDVITMVKNRVTLACVAYEQKTG